MNFLKRKQGWTGKHVLYYVVKHFGVLDFELISISKQRSVEVAGKYISLFTAAAHVQLSSNVAVRWMAVWWNAPQTSRNWFACAEWTSGRAMWSASASSLSCHQPGEGMLPHRRFLVQSKHGQYFCMGLLAHWCCSWLLIDFFYIIRRTCLPGRVPTPGWVPAGSPWP